MNRDEGKFIAGGNLPSSTKGIDRDERKSISAVQQEDSLAMASAASEVSHLARAEMS